MPNDEVLADKAEIANDQLSTQEADEERTREIERIRSMTIEEKFEQLERLYAEGQKIKRTEEEIAAEEADKGQSVGAMKPSGARTWVSNRLSGEA